MKLTRKLKPEAAYWLLVGGRSLLLSTIFTASMVYYINTVGLNPLQLVLVGTMLELSVLLFEVPTGVVADVYSRRLSILIGTALMGAGFMLEGMLPVFAAVLAAQVLWGIGHTFTSGATQAWIVDEVGEDQAGRIFLRGSQVMQVCGLVGLGLGAALGSLQLNVPLVAGGAGLVLLALTLAVGMPEHNFKPVAGSQGIDLLGGLKASRDTLRQAVRLVRVHPALMTIFTIGLVYGLYSEGYDRLSVAHLVQDIKLPELGGLSPVVWLAGIGVAESLVGLAVIEAVRQRLNTSHVASLTRSLFGLTALLVGALVGFGLSGNLVVAIGLMISIGVLRDLIGPLYDTWINQRLDSNVRATVISISGQVDALGQIAGGPGVGMIGNRISIPVALLASAGLLSPALWLYARALRGNRPASPAAVEAEAS